MSSVGIHPSGGQAGQGRSRGAVVTEAIKNAVMDDRGRARATVERKGGGGADLLKPQGWGRRTAEGRWPVLAVEGRTGSWRCARGGDMT